MMGADERMACSLTPCGRWRSPTAALAGNFVRRWPATEDHSHPSRGQAVGHRLASYLVRGVARCRSDLAADIGVLIRKARRWAGPFRSSLAAALLRRLRDCDLRSEGLALVRLGRLPLATGSEHRLCV